MSSLAPINVSATDKLRLLRRLDQYRRWDSLDDKRQCIQCGEIISGRDIEIVGGTRALGPLRLQCPTEGCPAIPMDWILPNDEGAMMRERRLARPVDDSQRAARGSRWFRRLLGARA